MEVQEDFKDLLKLLNDFNVEYVIVGGYALAFHGAPRFTGDIDILVKPHSQNAENIIKTLEAFGFGSLGLTKEDFVKLDNVIQLGVPPVRIDILTSISGIDWEAINTGKESGTYGNLPVYFIGLQELIVNKKASGRKKDHADLEALGEVDE